MTAATWPIGVALTSWDYIWRSTVLQRRELLEAVDRDHLPPSYPDGVDGTEVISVVDGHGPLFHRHYSTRIRESRFGPDELFRHLIDNLNRAAPTKFARFQRVHGDADTMALGDEFVVRQDDLLTFEIESWARSSGRFSNLLYHHVRMAKEIQLHMWISFLEGVVSMSGGRMTGGIHIDTRRVENGYGT
jgi:hypothetical protein